MSASRVINQPRGSTIVYVLFVLFVMTLLALTVATIMLRSNRTVAGQSHGIQGRFAAESGVERSLYYLQYARTTKTIGVESAISTIATFTSTFDTLASYSMAATATDDNYSVDIAQNIPQQWDIFGESYPNGSNQPPVLTALTDLDSVSISWDESSTCVSGNSYVEIAFSSWTQYEWEDISNPSTVRTRYLLHCPHSDPSNPADCNHSLAVDDTHLYKVRVKPLDCAIENVTVQALDSTAAAITTANLVTLSSTGEFGDSTRIMDSASTLWDPKLQHYFDFVVFSEEQIIK